MPAPLMWPETIAAAGSGTIGRMNSSGSSPTVPDGPDDSMRDGACGPAAARVPQSGTPGVRGLGARGAVIVFVVALVARGVAQWETASVPTVRHLIGDAAGYLAWAERIAAGAFIGEEAFYQAPLYPYLLAGLVRIFGSDVGVIRFVQAVAGAAGCVMVAAAAGRLFDRRVAWVAGLMMALYAPGIFYDGIVQKAALSNALTCVLVANVAWSQCQLGGWKLLVLGVVTGLLCLTRENALVWLVVIFIWLVVNPDALDVGGRVRRTAMFVLGVTATLLPACAHNAYISGQWSVTTFQAGPNFYIGNRAGADGRYLPLLRGHESPEFERSDATRLAEQAVGRSLSPGEVSAYWFDRARADIAADPLRWVKLMAVKTLMVINAYEVADAESLVVHARSSYVLSVLSRVWHFGVLFPMGVVGMVMAWRRGKPVGVFAVLAVVMIAAVAAFFVLGRYRLPLVPILVPFAAYGAVSVIEAFRAGRYRASGGMAAALIGLAVVTHVPLHDRMRLDAMAAMNAGVALARSGEVGAATALFEQAVSIHPTSPEANNNLGQARALAGRYDEAVTLYRRALAVDPDLVGVAYNLGVALERLGRREEALAAYRDALRVDPSDPAARAALARLGA